MYDKPGYEVGLPRLENEKNREMFTLHNGWYNHSGRGGTHVGKVQES